MLIEKKLRDFFYPVRKQKSTLNSDACSQDSRFDERIFYQRAEGFFNRGKERSNSNAKELIDALLAHGARSARFNQPHVRIVINVFGPDGHKTARIKMAGQSLSRQG